MDKENNSNEYIIYDKNKYLTSVDLYEKVFTSQFLEILKLAIGFLVSQLLYNLISISLLDYYKGYMIYQLIITIILLFILLYLGSELFAFLKIKNDKDELLKKYSSSVSN